MSAVGEMFRRLNPWHKDDVPLPPPITTGTASLLVVLYALSYFVPFYLSPTTRPSPTLSRDAPSVIRARIRSVALSCLVCTAATYTVLARTAGATPAEALHLLGLWPPAPAASLRALLLTALLFLGPLYSTLVVDGAWRDLLTRGPFAEAWTAWPAFRNLIAGPVTEEVLFRTASIPLFVVARASPAQTLFLTPVLFGLAHVHHLYEFRLTHPQVPAARALLRSVFQLGYTTLFGGYATFLFLRTGSLLAVCAVHAFCNCMGLPQVWGRVEPVPVLAGGDIPDTEGRNGGKRALRGAPSILWTVAYYVLLVSGAVLWWKNLWVLSESENALLATEAVWGGGGGQKGVGV
ncbi:Abi-domain-containing protein [Trichocladium antarcticum]|uniref:intramembrane prenyl-peptidase Rce1 n=1 Tax=Trichocladium antarcticum TaxID=1450529 RepID=A0AAN6UQJ2_9PEZI|nr:Abi-domain-containing protein [Trichocladium antarcticum]